MLTVPQHRLADYGQATVEIYYRLPDHPDLLQLFIWQESDLYPEFPRLRRFLDFWHHEIEGRLYSVRVAHKRFLTPNEFRIRRFEHLH